MIGSCDLTDAERAMLLNLVLEDRVVFGEDVQHAKGAPEMEAAARRALVGARLWALAEGDRDALAGADHIRLVQLLRRYLGEEQEVLDELVDDASARARPSRTTAIARQAICRRLLEHVDADVALAVG